MTRNHSFLLVKILVALAAAALLAYATAQGPNGYSDSAAYMVAGRHLAQGAGLGYLQPDGDYYTLTHYPPLYTVTFSLYTWPGLDLVEAGRWLNILALAGAVLALSALFQRFSAAPWLGALGAVILLVFPATGGVYASLMSDGPFLTLLLLSLLALLNYIHQPSRGRLAAAVLLTAALPLTRYIGLFCVAAAALILFLFASGSLGQRFKSATRFGLAALLPIGLWLGWVYLGVDASLGGRGGVEGGLLAMFQQFRAYFTDTVWGWIPFAYVPSALPYWLRQLIFLALAGGAVALALRMGNEEEAARNGNLLFWAFAISGAFYLLGLVAAFVFTAPAPDVTDRTLLPFFMCSLGTLLALAALAIERWPRAIWAGTAAVTLLFVAAFAGDTVDVLRDLHGGGLGFFTQRWRNSETIQALRELPADQVLVADRAAAFLFWADRPAYELLEVTGDELILDPDQGDLLVVFNDFPVWAQRLRGPEAASRAAQFVAGLEPLQAFDDGALYSLEP